MLRVHFKQKYGEIAVACISLLNEVKKLMYLFRLRPFHCVKYIFHDITGRFCKIYLRESKELKYRVCVLYQFLSKSLSSISAPISELPFDVFTAVKNVPY